MQVGKLIAGSEFEYSGKKYQIIRGVHGVVSRFRILEKTPDHGPEPQYEEITDRVYAYCFDTGTIGSFATETGVKLITIPDPTLSAPDENYPMPETARRDALLEMVAKYEIYKEHCIAVDAAKENRNAASDEYDAASAIAKDVCAKTDFRGTMVRGTMVIHVRELGIHIDDGEILE